MAAVGEVLSHLSNLGEVLPCFASFTEEELELKVLGGNAHCRICGLRSPV